MRIQIPYSSRYLDCSWINAVCLLRSHPLNHRLGYEEMTNHFLRTVTTSDFPQCARGMQGWMTDSSIPFGAVLSHRCSHPATLGSGQLSEDPQRFVFREIKIPFRCPSINYLNQ